MSIWIEGHVVVRVAQDGAEAVDFLKPLSPWEKMNWVYSEKKRPPVREVADLAC